MCTFVYTLTGALFYWLAGDSVASLALLSVPQPYRRAAFAVAWPVIFISGGLTTILCARSFLDQVFPKKQGRYSRRVWILTDAGKFLATLLYMWLIQPDRGTKSPFPEWVVFVVEKRQC